MCCCFVLFGQTPVKMVRMGRLTFYGEDVNGFLCLGGGCGRVFVDVWRVNRGTVWWGVDASFGVLRVWLVREAANVAGRGGFVAFWTCFDGWLVWRVWFVGVDEM